MARGLSNDSDLRATAHAVYALHGWLSGTSVTAIQRPRSHRAELRAEDLDDDAGIGEENEEDGCSHFEGI